MRRFTRALFSPTIADYLSTIPSGRRVAVLPLSGELLPQASRAELAAALRVVDYVVTPNESELDGLIEYLSPRQIVRLETSDLALVHELIEHVHRRQAR